MGISGASLTKEQEVLINHLRDLSERAAKTGCAASAFLAQTEVTDIVNRAKSSGVRIELDGGHEAAERIRVINKRVILLELQLKNEKRISTWLQHGKIN